MNVLYNEYLTGAEREAAIIIAESDAQFAKLNILFETIDATIEANKLSAEAKVFVENGTYDDLVLLYTEAEQEAKTKKRGVIAAILDAIGSLFTKIGNFLTEKFGKALDNIPAGKHNIDANLEKQMNWIQKAWNFLKKPFETIAAGSDAGVDEEDIKKAWGQIIGEFAAIAGTAGAGALVVVNREKIVGWVKMIRDEIQKKVNAAIGKLKAVLGVGKVVNDTIKSANNEPIEEKNFGDKILGAGKAVLDFLVDLGRKISSWIGKLASSIGVSKNDLVKEAKQKDKSDVTRQHQANGDEMTGESTEDTDDSGETFIESADTDGQFNELLELFNEL